MRGPQNEKIIQPSSGSHHRLCQKTEKTFPAGACGLDRYEPFRSFQA